MLGAFLDGFLSFLGYFYYLFPLLHCVWFGFLHQNLIVLVMMRKTHFDLETTYKLHLLCVYEQ